MYLFIGEAGIVCPRHDRSQHRVLRPAFMSKVLGTGRGIRQRVQHIRVSLSGERSCQRFRIRSFISRERNFGSRQTRLLRKQKPEVAHWPRKKRRYIDYTQLRWATTPHASLRTRGRRLIPLKNFVPNSVTSRARPTNAYETTYSQRTRKKRGTSRVVATPPCISYEIGSQDTTHA